MARLSCHRFRSNEVRLWLSVIAYNLGNLWRRLVLPRRIDNWSLTSLQQRLVKTGGRLVMHARYYWLLLAESHLTRRLFGSMVRRIAALPLPTGEDAGAGMRPGEGREEWRGVWEIAQNKAVPCFPVPGRGRNCPHLGRRSRSGWKHQNKRANGGDWVYTLFHPGRQNGNPWLRNPARYNKFPSGRVFHVHDKRAKRGSITVLFDVYSLGPGAIGATEG